MTGITAGARVVARSSRTRVSAWAPGSVANLLTTPVIYSLAVYLTALEKAHCRRLSRRQGGFDGAR